MGPPHTGTSGIGFHLIKFKIQTLAASEIVQDLLHTLSARQTLALKKIENFPVTGIKVVREQVDLATTVTGCEFECRYQMYSMGIRGRFSLPIALNGVVVGERDVVETLRNYQVINISILIDFI